MTAKIYTVDLSKNIFNNPINGGAAATARRSVYEDQI